MTLTQIISKLNEIEAVTRDLYQVENRRTLHVKATKISDLALQAGKWANTLEGERHELEDRVLELENELAALKGEPLKTANDKFTPDFSKLQHGVKRG
jgi:hypothetical protein